MKLTVALMLMLTLAIGTRVLGAELSVHVPQGEHDFWLKWSDGAGEKEGKHSKAAGEEFKVALDEIPAEAKSKSLLVLNTGTGLLAEEDIPAAETMTLTEADFHVLPELTVTVRVPSMETNLVAEVVLEQSGAKRSAPAEITGTEGKASFKMVDVLPTSRLRINAPAYSEYQEELSLLGQDKKAIPTIEVGLTKPVVSPPPQPVEPRPERTAWFLFFLIGTVVLGLASLVLGSVSLVTGDAFPTPSSGAWLLSIWGLPSVGLVGWWICEVVWASSGPEKAGALLLPLLGWAFLAMSVVGVRSGRRFLSASGLVGAAAFASQGLALIPPSRGGLTWVTFVFAALVVMSGLVGGLMVAFARPLAAPAVVPRPDLGVRPGEYCPYCGQRKDPVTGKCGCETAVRREAAGARLVVQRGDATGQTFPLGRSFTIGREAGNDLVLNDMTVSRRHCAITGEGNRFAIQDEGSANGTFVNGERITSRVLTPGDDIQVGGSTIRFEM